MIKNPMKVIQEKTHAGDMQCMGGRNSINAAVLKYSVSPHLSLRATQRPIEATQESNSSRLQGR